MSFASCSGDGGDASDNNSASPSAPTSPTATSASSDDSTSVDAAKAVAQEEADRYSAQDYGGAWDLWTTEGKKAISRTDYEKLHAACPGPGVAYDIENVRIESPGKAIARLSVMGFKQAYELRYEDGSWRWQSTADDMKDYALGVDKMIAKKKAEGSC